jgi:nicotinate-nucleotide adenylyltransferase
MSSIIVFGGTFSPPHLGHQLMIRQVLQNYLADEVWLLPVGQHSFAKLAPYHLERLEMLEILRQDLAIVDATLSSKIKINSYELDRAEESQTYASLVAIAKQYPEHKFSFLIGSDNLANFDKWHHYQEMLSQFPFYVYPRADVEMAPLYQGMTALSQMPQSRVSSTRVRQALANGEDLTDLLSPAMIEYLEQHPYMYER